MRGCITVLLDKVVLRRSEALAEHGFSVHIGTSRGNFLFGTGKGRAIIHNANLSQKDLNKIREVLLSHSHGDHTGELPDVLWVQANKPLEVRAHPDTFPTRYRVRDGEKTYGGIPYTCGYLEKMGARFHFNSEYRGIEDGIFLTGEIPRETSFEEGDMANRFAIRDGEETPDIILADQSLVLYTERGW